jgi:hypothetical protein
MAPPLGPALETVLRRALGDAAFRAALLGRGAAAALDAGIALAAPERAALDAATPAQLEAMLASLPPEPRPPGAPALAETSAGIRPGLIAQGARPDVDPVRGSRPEREVVKGLRPGLPIAVAAGAVLVGGALVGVCATAGVRPDAPGPPAPTAAWSPSSPSSPSSPAAPDAAPSDSGRDDGGAGRP